MENLREEEVVRGWKEQQETKRGGVGGEVLVLEGRKRRRVAGREGEGRDGGAVEGREAGKVAAGHVKEFTAMMGWRGGT